MTLLLYMDVHVHVEITAALRRRAVDAITAQDDRNAHLDDPELLDRATELGRVLVSFDKDFLREAARRQRNGIFFAGVIFAEQLGISIGQAIDQLELLAKIYDPEDLRNRLERIPL